MGWFLLRPLPVPWVYGTNVRPLATLDREMVSDPMACVRTIGTGVGLLAPLGLLLPLIGGKTAVSTTGSLLRTVFLGAAVSFTFESLQTGVPGQVFDVDSILLNTVGVGVAHLLVVPGVRSRLRRDNGGTLATLLLGPPAPATPDPAPRTGPPPALADPPAPGPSSEKALMTASLPVDRLM